MDSFSLSYGNIEKCCNSNPTLPLKKYSKSQKLRVEPLDWERWRKEFFELNQSQNKMNQSMSSEGEIKPEGIGVNDLNVILLDNEHVPKKQPIHIATNSSDNSSVADIFSMCMANNSTFGSCESNSPFYSTNKAIFTILIPSSKILVVNSAACQLLNYSSDELCSLKLENIIQESNRSKFYSLQDNFLKNSNQVLFNNTKLVELVQKEGGVILVFLSLQKIDNPQRCLAVAEPIEQNKILISVDENGKILSCDEEICLSFQYEASDLVGVNIPALLPAINLSKGIENQCRVSKQRITGRNKNGEVFPVFVTIDRGNLNSEVYQIMILVPLGLSGQIYLNKGLFITNFNCSTKMLFGFSKKDIVNRSITYLIPTFCKDVKFEKSKRGQCRNGNASALNELSLSSCQDKFGSDGDSFHAENSLKHDCMNDVKSSVASLSLSNSSLKPLQNSDSVKSESGDNCCLKTLFTFRSEEKIRNNRDLSIPILDLENESSFEGKFETSSNDASLLVTTQDSKKGLDSQNESFLVQEGKFLGRGRHYDGSYIDILYQVKISAISEDAFYCVWLSGDLKKSADVFRGSNTNATVTSSFNSSSFESSLPRDNNCSGQYTRPSSASMISQCDEFLTAGEYSEYYTNIRQIGKGAFGYVKMAFRNSDGLLVVTKFIKKQKINVRSWVFNRNLNMKIPLEVSLLTALQHPNIVKVLDVFHNDSFVQLVMEKHGAGFDLFEFIDRKPKCDEKLKSYIFRQITSAVHYLNSLGILHRDIKDENVIINEKFEVKLIDFGSATFMPPEETFSRFYGTVDYCSPEVLQGNNYKGPELEIWALGVTLYVLTFGENPFYDVLETIKGEFSIPSPISKELNDLLHCMLDKNVETRITIDKLIENPWINQPVDIKNYRFTEVVRCYDEEAFPPKYVSDIRSDEFHSKRGLKSSNGLIADLSNFHDIPEDDLSDIEDGFQKVSTNTSELQPGGHQILFSPTLFSSTPLQKKSDRLCRSAVDLRRRLENVTPLSNHCLEHCKSDLINRRPELFDLEPKSLIKMEDVENLESNKLESESNENKTNDLELEVYFKRPCFTEENNLCWTESTTRFENDDLESEIVEDGEESLEQIENKDSERSVNCNGVTNIETF